MTAFAQMTISEQDRQTIIDYYKCVCFGLTIDWLDGGMTEAYTQSIRRIFLLKKDLAVEIVQLLQTQV